MLSAPVQPVPLHRLMSTHSRSRSRSRNRTGRTIHRVSSSKSLQSPGSPMPSRAPSPPPPGTHTPRRHLLSRTHTPAPHAHHALDDFTLAMHPDLADEIMISCDYETQTSLRAVCRYFRDAVDAHHARHIALRVAMCRSPIFRDRFPPPQASPLHFGSGVHLIIARPTHNVRHDTDRIYGYFYCGNCVPGLGYALAFNTAVLSDPPQRQKDLLKHTRVLDVYPNDIDWEFAAPRAQLDGAVSSLDPERVHTVRYAEEVDPWWYTRHLTPSLVVFDLRHFDAARPGKHSTYSYSLASPRIPTSATRVVIHVPVRPWRFASAPLDGFLVPEGTRQLTLLFMPGLNDHAVQWEGQAPPLGILHKFLQDNRERFPHLQLVIAGYEHVNPRVFGRAFSDTPGGRVEDLPNRIAAAIRDAAGTVGCTAEQADSIKESVTALTTDEYKASLDPSEWEIYTSFPHYT